TAHDDLLQRRAQRLAAHVIRRDSLERDCQGLEVDLRECLIVHVRVVLLGQCVPLDLDLDLEAGGLINGPLQLGEATVLELLDPTAFCETHRDPFRAGDNRARGAGRWRPTYRTRSGTDLQDHRPSGRDSFEGGTAGEAREPAVGAVVAAPYRVLL